MPSDAVHFAGGVYEIIPGRLAIGPMMHVKLLIQKPAGAIFGSVKLAEPTSRYFVSCLPLAPSLSPLPPGPSAATSHAENQHLDPTVGTTTTTGKEATPPVSPRPPLSASTADGPAARASQMGSAARPGNSSVADFLAKMKERQALARRPSAAAGAGAAAQGPSPSAAAPSATLASNASAAAVDEARGSDQAAHNAALKQLATDTLGARHYQLCHMVPSTLQTPQVTEAVEFMRNTLADDPQAFIYVFSGSGKGRASALAMLYMLQVEKAPLRETTRTLALSTPRLTYMMELLQLEKARAAQDGVASDFDDNAWFTKYFSIRYPDRNTKAVRAAVESCNGDYTRADRILQEELFFAKSVADTNKRKEQLKAANAVDSAADRAELNSQTFGGLDDREQSRLSFFTSSFTPPAEGPPIERGHSGISHSAMSLSKGTQDLDSCSAQHAPAILGMPNLGGFGGGQGAAAESQSNLSGSSDSGAPLPLAALSPLDEDMIRTIVRALRSCDVAASPEEVRQSYLRHRRNKTRVMADFLKSGTDNAKLMGLVKALPTTVPSRTPRSSAATSSAQFGKPQNGSFRQATRYRSDASQQPSPRQELPPTSRDEPSPEPERPSSDVDECTPSDIDDADETITSTVEKAKLNAFTFPTDA